MLCTSRTICTGLYIKEAPKVTQPTNSNYVRHFPFLVNVSKYALIFVFYPVTTQGNYMTPHNVRINAILRPNAKRRQRKLNCHIMGPSINATCAKAELPSANYGLRSKTTFQKDLEYISDSSAQPCLRPHAKIVHPIAQTAGTDPDMYVAYHKDSLTRFQEAAELPPYLTTHRHIKAYGEIIKVQSHASFTST